MKKKCTPFQWLGKGAPTPTSPIFEGMPRKRPMGKAQPHQPFRQRGKGRFHDAIFYRINFAN